MGRASPPGGFVAPDRCSGEVDAVSEKILVAVAGPANAVPDPLEARALREWGPSWVPVFHRSTSATARRLSVSRATGAVSVEACLEEADAMASWAWSLARKIVAGKCHPVVLGPLRRATVRSVVLGSVSRPVLDSPLPMLTALAVAPSQLAYSSLGLRESDTTVSPACTKSVHASPFSVRRVYSERRIITSWMLSLF
jgi:hypothetical protein